MQHLALLDTTFMPAITQSLQGRGDMPRRWRRVYAAILMPSNPEAFKGVLRVSGVPASWRGNQAAAVGNVQGGREGGDGEGDGDGGGGGCSGGGDGRLVLRYKDKVVADIDLSDVEKLRAARPRVDLSESTADVD